MIALIVPRAMNDAILIIEDDPAYSATLKQTLELNGYRTVSATSFSQGQRLCQAQVIAGILLDIKLPGSDGFIVLEWLRSNLPGIPVIMMTQEPSYEKAVRAVKMGAFDFIPKEILDRDRLLVTLHNALDKARIEGERAGLLQALQTQSLLIGESRAMRELKTQIERVAATDERVLIIGESGTGKELVANAIYSRSRRASKSYVKVNCAAIPRDLIESELFGHKKGAFTGARQDHEGKFKAADGGTIFLDEIGDMGLDLQAKVLRTLQEGEIEPVGGKGPEKINVRVVAATNKDLKAMVKEGTFREDLYFRLNSIQLTVPPLRDHIEDIPLLMVHLLKQAAERNNRPMMTLNEAATNRMLSYDWPGNIRELESLATWISVYVVGPEVALQDVNSWFGTENGGTPTSEALPDYWNAKQEFERDYFKRLLVTLGGNVAATARAANLDRAGLHRKLKALGIVE